MPLSVTFALISTKILGHRHYYCPHYITEEKSREVKKQNQVPVSYLLQVAPSPSLLIPIPTLSS